MRFEPNTDDNIQFSISDDGIGIPEHIFLKSTNSLGLNLIKVLTEQIDGKLEFLRDSGTYLIVRFNDSHKKEEFWV